MDIAITGTEGQLGRAFQDVFSKNNITSHALTRQDLDITNLTAVRTWLSEHPVDFLINCAAYTNVDAAEAEWHQAFLVNGLGARNLAIAAEQSDAVLIHFSTDYVFDGYKNNPYTIIDKPRPLSKYGDSKLLGEKMIQQINKKHFIIRTSWLFGDGPDNFPNKIKQWSHGRSELKVVTDQVSTPTYAVDLAKGSWELMKTRAYGLYHLTNRGYCSRYEWASYILQKIGWKGTLIRATENDFITPARRPNYSVLDNFGAQETSGWEMPEWKDAMDRYM
jgi:dTDP-4-dehydrorhamnose reductase